jgi:DNA ligase-associated metallophosphoesterase
MASGLTITVRGEDIVLLAQRAFFWPRQKTLVVADLHWGKSETFVASGVPLPLGASKADLTRLGALIRSSGAERLLVLGDLVHGARGVIEPLVRLVKDFRGAHPVSLQLVTGNHDVRNLPPDWNIQRVGPFVDEGPFRFRHTPEEGSDRFVWAGHLHPTVCLEGGGDKLRLPCFRVSASCGVVPAFSDFTNGIVMLAEPGVMRYAIADEHVVPLDDM